MLYETCVDLSPDLWEELLTLEPAAVIARSGAVFREGAYSLPYLDRQLVIHPASRRIETPETPGSDPGHRAGLTALCYLLYVDIHALGPAAGPLELTGGEAFFRGVHAVPRVALEARFGRDAPGFLAAGRRLGGALMAAGDAALFLPVFPGLAVEVILWQADDEFPAQVSFMVPENIDRFWQLDAVFALLELVRDELLRAAAPQS
jgi:hypothetical protein